MMEIDYAKKFIEVKLLDILLSIYIIFKQYLYSFQFPFEHLLIYKYEIVQKLIIRVYDKVNDDLPNDAISFYIISIVKLN